MSDGRRRPRLLVFIVAYYAESTMTSVLERIPTPVFDDYDCEVLVVDDASADRTYERARGPRARTRSIRMTVLRNGHNQGYGGNQKVGYTYAIEHGFDIVVLVHGDGQYAPGGAAAAARPAARRPGRRRLRQPDDDGVRRAARRHAALQVRRQQDPDSRHAERPAAAPTFASSTAATALYSVAALQRIRFR